MNKRKMLTILIVLLFNSITWAQSTSIDVDNNSGMFGIVKDIRLIVFLPGDIRISGTVVSIKSDSLILTGVSISKLVIISKDAIYYMPIDSNAIDTIVSIKNILYYQIRK